MQQSETRTLWISIGSAVFAVVLLYGWAQDKRANYARTFGQTKTVVVAREDIREMEIVDESKMEVVEKPAEFVQPGAIQNPIEVVGQIALAPIKKGEQILNTKLVFPDKSTGLSMQVAPGKRAITLDINESQGVAKLIKPGDRVDIIAAVDDGNGINKVRKARTIMQDSPVLAVGQNIVDNIPVEVVMGNNSDYEVRNLRVSNDYKTITIEASPSEAQILIYLQSTRTPIHFSLRNPNDRIKNSMPVTDMNEVLNRTARLPAQKKATPKPKIVPKQAAPATKPKRKSGGRFEKL